MIPERIPDDVWPCSYMTSHYEGRTLITKVAAFLVRADSYESAKEKAESFAWAVCDRLKLSPPVVTVNMFAGEGAVADIEDGSVWVASTGNMTRVRTVR